MRDFFAGEIANSSGLIMYLFLSHLPIIWYVNLFCYNLKIDEYVGNSGGIIRLLIIDVIFILLIYLLNKRKYKNVKVCKQ